MCNPVLLGVGGLIAGIGGAVVNYSAQQSQASAARSYQQQMYEATKAQAQRSLISQYSDLAVRQAQEDRKASQEIQAIARQALEARSRAYASSLEAGVAGVSIDNLMQEYVRREGEFITRTRQQNQAIQMQLQNQKWGLMAEAESRILGATPRPVEGPSALALGLNIAGSAADFFAIEENFDGVFGSIGLGGTRTMTSAGIPRSYGVDMRGDIGFMA